MHDDLPAPTPDAKASAANAAAAPFLYGVAGHPVRHSLSPVLHNAAFRASGFSGAYTAWDIPPERLADFVGAVRLLGIRGVSVTIPHKENIGAFVDAVDPLAQKVGAVNTLVRREDGTLFATNTDVYGFSEPLRDLQLPAATPVLLLGAGGAARAAAAGLLALGFSNLAVTSRSLEKAARLAGDFALRAIPWERRLEVVAELVVNVTPLGMAGKNPGETPYPLSRLREGSGVVYDTVYTPYHTRLLREAKEAGWRTLPGLGMFIMQGAEQFRLWTGFCLPLVAAEAVARELYGADAGEMLRHLPASVLS